MENRRPITEEDVLLTELLLARSYGRLKRSVADTASRSLRSAGDAVGDTVRKHPYATAGAAIGAGVLLYGLFRLMERGGSSRRGNSGSRERSSRPDITMEILSMLMPVITPYITAYVEKYLGRTFLRRRH